jgi:hypothetical protein
LWLWVLLASLSGGLAIGIALVPVGIYLKRKRDQGERQKAQSGHYEDIAMDDIQGSKRHLTRTFPWEIPMSEVKLHEQIGKGAYSMVYRGTWRNQGKPKRKENLKISDQ